MVKYMSRILFLGALLIFSLALSADAKLYGKWILTFDPDGPVTEDWMLFGEGSEVDLGDAEGVYLTCPYKVEKQSVIVICNVRGKTKQLVMSGKDNYRQLVNPSGAIYTRQ
ncbi:MAG: hypothetical protein OEQ39_14305 [Gammaproteobacteria bacterium]|nr:hypothetical protein [Gammaproteobacteria bacterium]MDH3378115.1 hypothetical protein [Gammaproteobacteria bacterium]